MSEFTMYTVSQEGEAFSVLRRPVRTDSEVHVEILDKPAEDLTQAFGGGISGFGLLGESF